MTRVIFLYFVFQPRSSEHCSILIKLAQHADLPRCAAHPCAPTDTGSVNSSLNDILVIKIRESCNFECDRAPPFGTTQGTAAGATVRR